MSQLLTLEEAAALLRKSPAQMRWMRHNGSGPKSAKIGGRIMLTCDYSNAKVNYGTMTIEY